MGGGSSKKTHYGMHRKDYRDPSQQQIFNKLNREPHDVYQTADTYSVWSAPANSAGISKGGSQSSQVTNSRRMSLPRISVRQRETPRAGDIRLVNGPIYIQVTPPNEPPAESVGKPLRSLSEEKRQKLDELRRQRVVAHRQWSPERIRNKSQRRKRTAVAEIFQDLECYR